MTIHPGQIGAEPKDGDFVAYLREIERRQMAAMQEIHFGTGNRPAPSPAGPGSQPVPGSDSSHRSQHRSEDRPPLNKAQAEAVMDVLTSQSQARHAVASQAFIGGLIVAFFALVFFVGGASTGHIVPMVIGAVLGVFALTRLRKAFRGDGGDLAERLRRAGFKG